ncbi:hypothetical protein [Paraburkholderia sp. DHOC27]|uniref:hypothetical protein n=1 Tax=Paraburkholderia sp. DHOC27 TaxID=2303330 RepID=UPI0011C13C8E|nr:hypothetical protein [Paraburkholderia sp. DHOC27]
MTAAPHRGNANRPLRKQGKANAKRRPNSRKGKRRKSKNEKEKGASIKKPTRLPVQTKEAQPEKQKT